MKLTLLDRFESYNLLRSVEARPCSMRFFYSTSIIKKVGGIDGVEQNTCDERIEFGGNMILEKVKVLYRSRKTHDFLLISQNSYNKRDILKQKNEINKYAEIKKDSKMNYIKPLTQVRGVWCEE